MEHRLQAGARAPDFERDDYRGHRVSLRDFRGKKLLLSFHRFAACPYCNHRIYRLRREFDELAAAGLAVVAFFQSEQEVIARGVGQQEPPFPIIGDHAMEVYAKYGVIESSTGAVLKALWRMHVPILSLARGHKPFPVDGDMKLKPASFLIDEDGVVRHPYYAGDVGDHMPLSTVREFVGLPR